MERNLFPAFSTNQIDQSSPAGFIHHRPWKTPKKIGFKTFVVLFSSVTGVSVIIFDSNSTFESAVAFLPHVRLVFLHYPKFDTDTNVEFLPCHTLCCRIEHARIWSCQRERRNLAILVTIQLELIAKQTVALSAFSFSFHWRIILRYLGPPYGIQLRLKHFPLTDIPDSIDFELS